MAKTDAREEKTRVRRAVQIAYLATGKGASSDTILCSDERRSRFDQMVQTACRAYGCSVTPEEARRTLLRLRKTGALRQSSES